MLENMVNMFRPLEASETSVANEDNFDPKIPTKPKKIDVSVSSNNLGENRNFLFIFIFMPNFV
jgi:hypothetical protein